MKNAFTQSPDIEVGDGEFVSAPDFFDTVGASLSYKYMPLLNKVNELYSFGTINDPVDAGYSAFDNIPKELRPYSSSLIFAKNQDHMDFLVGNLRESMNTRAEIESSGMFSMFGAEFFDPINYISIPLRIAGSIKATAFASGVATAKVVAAQEIIRHPVDPLSTTSETVMNIGSSAVFGTALGGLMSIPANRRALAAKNAEAEASKLAAAVEPIDGVEVDPNIAPSTFTDSWLFKAVTTPMKRVLQDVEVPNIVKLTLLSISNDAGILLNANRQGHALKNSVFQNAKLRDGEWVQTYDRLTKIWGESTGKGVSKRLDYMQDRKSFEQFLTDIDAKAMRGEKPADGFEARVMDELNSFYGTWETRLTDTGLIGNRGGLEREIAYRNDILKNTNKSLKTAKDKEIIGYLHGVLRKPSAKIKEAQESLDKISDTKVLPANEEIFRPRYWDKDRIAANRQQLEKIFADWFRENPEGFVFVKGKGYVKTKFSTDNDAINKRAIEAVDNILGLKDVTDFDAASFGHGKSKHLKHRAIDIPNKLVLDFIHRNPVSIMKAYTARTAARYEFANQFGGKDIDDILNEAISQMLESGMTLEKSFATSVDIRHMYDRVAGTVIREPDALNQKVAEGMRTAAQLGYLGSAGVATITEPAKIIMEHGIGPVMRGLFNILADEQLKMGAKEARIAGEALEILMGSSHLRLVEDMGNNPLRSNYMDKTKNAFYLLNGLAPITRIFKDFDGMMRSHTLIDYSVRWTRGEASKMEQEYLLRYGIDLNTADKIANAPWQKSESGMYIADTEAWTNTIEFPATKAKIITGKTNRYSGDRYMPAFYSNDKDTIHIDVDYVRDVMWEKRGWENPHIEGVNPIKEGIINTPDDLVTFVKMHEIMHSLNTSKSMGIDKRTKKGKADYENAINDLAIAEIEKQARVSPETVKSFRNALSSGIANTILMGTPADKPIITDGIVYIPMRVAKQFGMKEDPSYKGYARIENGLLGLPFQFYSYALAATNKTMAAYGHGQLKNQFLGTAIAMGLGYMVLDIKTPDWVDLSFQDKFARSFDYSGIAPIHSDLIYTAMATSLALGGPNLTGGALAPRYPQEENYVDAVTGLTGAGPSIAHEYIRGMYNIMSGNVGEGTKEFVRALPFSNLWMIKDLVNKYTRMFEKEVDGNFGRY